jgi:hypothetical protein
MKYSSLGTRGGSPHPIRQMHQISGVSLEARSIVMGQGRWKERSAVASAMESHGGPAESLFSRGGHPQDMTELKLSNRFKGLAQDSRAV